MAFFQRPKSQLAFRLFLPSFERSNKTGISINHATVVNQKTNGFTKVIFKHAFILDFPFFLPLTGWKRHRRNREENDKTISGSLRNRFVIPKGKHKKNQNSIELPLPLMEDDGKSGKQAKVKRFSMDEKGVLLFGGLSP